MTRDRVAVVVVALLTGGPAVAVVLLRPPMLALARHGALSWALVLGALVVLPALMLVCHRRPLAWSGLLVAWLWVVVGTTVRLHRWLTAAHWVALATLVVLVTAAVAVRLNGPGGTPRRSRTRGPAR